MNYKKIKESELWLPKDIGFRFIKLKMLKEDGTKYWKTYVIHSKKELLKFLRKNPIDVYISKYNFACVNNKTTHSKKYYVIKKRTCFDFDGIGIKEVINLLPHLDKDKIEYLINTSKLSYQLSTLELFSKEKLKDLKEISDFDLATFEDDKSVIRYPNTFHHSGHFVNYIPLDLKGIWAIAKSEMRTDLISTSKNKRKRRPQRILPLTYKFCWNKVSKDLFIFYGRWKDIEYLRLRDRLIKAQNIYDIGDIYIIGSKSYIMAMSLKCFSLRRLQKIHNFLRPQNKPKCHIRTSGKRYENIEIEDKPQGIAVLKQEVNGVFSERHKSLLKYFGFPIEEGMKEIRTYQGISMEKIDGI